MNGVYLNTRNCHCLEKYSYISVMYFVFLSVLCYKHSSQGCHFKRRPFSFTLFLQYEIRTRTSRTRILYTNYNELQSLTIFFWRSIAYVHLDKKINFVNHITEMFMKVQKSIGPLYNRNSFLPETILKTLYTSLIHPYLSYGIEAWHGKYQNNTSKIVVLQKKAIRAINNLAYNYHTNAYIKFNVTKYSNFLISISFKFRTIFFNYYTPILMKK